MSKQKVIEYDLSGDPPTQDVFDHVFALARASGEPFVTITLTHVPTRGLPRIICDFGGLVADLVSEIRDKIGSREGRGGAAF